MNNQGEHKKIHGALSSSDVVFTAPFKVSNG